MPNSPPIAMVFAAADPTGGAGLQADVMTIVSLGCHPVSVLTAVTVQDTHGVRAVQPLAATLVIDQARALLEEFRISAFKFGVLGSTENVEAICALLAGHRQIPVVLDPVLASGRGDALASQETLDALRASLVPLATVVTPNSVEARRLARAAPTADLAECARTLLGLGAANVLVTGTHEPGAEVTNTLYGANAMPQTRRWPRLAGSYHGSGCTLASAIAAQLAHGSTVPEAVRVAQEYTWHALAAGFQPAAGQFIPNRLVRLQDAKRGAAG